MSDLESIVHAHKARKKELRKLTRKLDRANEQLRNYERVVDRTQHMLNTRIAEVEAAREELKQSEARCRQLAEAAFEAIITHADGRILDCNEAALGLYRLNADQLIGQPILDRVHPSFHQKAGQWLHQSTQEPIEVKHLHGDGTAIPVEVRSRAIVHMGQAAMVTVVRDITAHKQLQEELLKIANSDPLTGAGNRRFFMETGNHEIFRSLRYAQPLALLMLDVDHFKMVNDTFGHNIGDLALRALTDVCRATLRDSDIFGRIGGEEFAAVLPNTNLAEAVPLAERLRRKVQDLETPIDTGTDPLKFTISVGVTALRPEDGEIAALLRRADQSLYIAKESGRNRVEKVA